MNLFWKQVALAYIRKEQVFMSLQSTQTVMQAFHDK